MNENQIQFHILNENILGLAFLVSFAAPNKQFFRVSSSFRSCDHVFKSEIIYTFTPLFGVKGALPCFKKLTLNSSFILELFIHTGFRERHLFDVKGGVNFSLDNTLDFHMEIVSKTRKC